MGRKKKRGKVKSARTRAENHTSGFERTSVNLPEGVERFKPEKVGVYKIDIVPYEVGKGRETPGGNPYADAGDHHPERTFFTHRGIGPNEDTVVCLNKTFKKPCPICEHRSVLAKDHDADEVLVKSLAPKERQLWNVFDHDDPDKGVQVWDISFHLFGKQLDAQIKNSDEDDGFEFYHDPDEGLTLKVGLGEKSFAGNKFLEAETINFSRKTRALSDEVFEAAVNLDDCLIEMDYDKLKAMFLQTGDDEPEPESEEPENPPAKKRGKRSATTGGKSGKKDETDDKPTEPSDGDDDDIPFDDDDKLQCPACQGTGKNSKGGKCVPCKGTGYLDRPTSVEPESEPEEPDSGKKESDDGDFDTFDDDDDWE